jgi:predicted ATPase
MMSAPWEIPPKNKFLVRKISDGSTTSQPSYQQARRRKSRRASNSSLTTDGGTMSEAFSTTSSEYLAQHGVISKDPFYDGHNNHKMALLRQIRRSKLFEREEHETRILEAFHRSIMMEEDDHDNVNDDDHNNNNNLPPSKGGEYSVTMMMDDDDDDDNGLPQREQQHHQPHSHTGVSSLQQNHDHREIIIITGSAGTGKSTLARTTLEAALYNNNNSSDGDCSVHDPKLFLLQGKCDQIPNAEPLAPFVQAFTQLVNDILVRDAAGAGAGAATTRTGVDTKKKSSGSVADSVRDAIIRATEDSNVKSLTDMIPALDRILSSRKMGSNVVSEKYTTTSTKPPSNRMLVSKRHYCYGADPTAISFQQEYDSSSGPGDTVSTIGSFAYDPKRTSNHHRTRAHVVANPGVAVVCKFLQELCEIEGFKIVLLIDDLQWLDTNSAQMFDAISSIPTQSISKKNFMLVGTFRHDGDDFDDGHNNNNTNTTNNNIQLSDTLKRLTHPSDHHHHHPHQLGSVTVTEIHLQNLRQETVAQMLIEWLNVDNANDIRVLAELLYRDSGGGNPFIVIEQIRALLEKRLLFFTDDGGWMWEDSDILRHSMELGDTDISDIVIRGTICRSSDPANETLQIAACLGTEFSVKHLGLVATSSRKGIARALKVLVAKGLIVPTTNDTNDDSTNEGGRRYRWAHDQFQRSAFSLIPLDHREAFLYSVGKKLRDRLPEEELISNIFLVVKLLDYGIRVSIQGENELEQMAGLLSIAGTKAAQASAFDDAASYFRRGIELLPPGHWDKSTTHALSQQLYNCSAEMECCLGNATRVDELVETILIHSRCLQDQLRAYHTQIYSLSCRKEMLKSIRVGLDVLRQLDEYVPRRITLLHNMRQLVTTTLALRRVTCEDVLRLRPMRNWQKAAALQIINLVFPPVLRCQPEYALFLAAKGVKLTMKYGLSPVSSLMFSAFGMIVCHPVGQIEEGSRYEEIGWKIFEKFVANDLRSRIDLMRYAYVKPWKDSMKGCLPSLVAGANSGMMTGDFEMAFINYFEYCLCSLFAGVSLREHYGQILHIKQKFLGLGQETVMFYLDFVIQLTKCLLGGGAQDPHVLSRDMIDAKVAIDDAIATNNPSGVSYTLLSQLYLALFTGDYHHAVKIGRQLQQSNTDSFGAMEVQYYTYMVSLSEMIVSRETMKASSSSSPSSSSFSSRNSRQHVRAGDRALKELIKWTKFAPDSWLNRIQLIKAERCAIQGNYEEATKNYFSSIDCAEQFGWIHEQALALERAGIFLLEIGSQVGKGLDCLYKSRDLYDQWGCIVKCNQITQLISVRRGDDDCCMTTTSNE